MTKNLSNTIGKADRSITADKIAQYFIWQSQKEGKPITNKKLQKLVYYAQAWYVTLEKKALFADKIEAWIHGPAIKRLYGKYKEYGANPITQAVDMPNLNTKVISFLQEVWAEYGKYDAQYLEILSHNETPWQKAREGLDVDEASETIIKQEDMAAYYQTLLKDGKEA